VNGVPTELVNFGVACVIRPLLTGVGAVYALTPVTPLLAAVLRATDQLPFESAESTVPAAIKTPIVIRNGRRPDPAIWIMCPWPSTLMGPAAAF
jgi:hypothetical protein